MKSKLRVGSTIEIGLVDGTAVAATLVRWSNKTGKTVTKSLATGAIFDIGEKPIHRKGYSEQLNWQEVELIGDW